jgi:16S rRNA processing protein RimM|tara:strand:+ start:999 stop:1520 length:522 start_codon:yes stop_codon:yes gene_type:complete
MDLQSDKNQETIILGRISGHYGVKGWVKIFSYTKPIEGILSYSECYIDGVNTFKSGRILEGRKQGKLIIVKLSGVNDRDTAEDYIGLNLILPADCLPKLDDGHYYWRELEGLSVVDMQSKKLGVVSKLLETGANDVMVIQGDNQILIPFVMHEVIKEVDLSEGRIVVDWEWVD